MGVFRYSKAGACAQKTSARTEGNLVKNGEFAIEVVCIANPNTGGAQ